MSPLAVVIADTHLPRRASALPEGLIPHLERADLILHAGDLMDSTLLDELAAYAPVRAVRGNLDPPEAKLPETLQFEFGGVRIAMTHDSGRKRGRRNRMRQRFPGAREDSLRPSTQTRTTYSWCSRPESSTRNCTSSPAPPPTNQRPSWR